MEFYNKSPQMDLSGKTCYSGRYLYNYPMTSTLNRKPITLLSTAVKSSLNNKALLKPLVPDLESTLNRLLVDGSLIIYNGGFVDGEFKYLSNMEAIVERGDHLYTHLIRVGSRVQLTDWKEFEPENIKTSLSEGLNELIEAPVFIPGNLVVFFPNAEGILAPVQKSLIRIEEIYHILQKTTPMEALIFMTNMANSADKMNAAISDKLTSDKPIVPIPAGSTIQQPNFGNLTSRLFSELNLIVPEYTEATFGYTINPSESGIARKLGMAQFLSKIDELQQQCIQIYNQLDYVDLVFNNYDITEAAEDKIQIENLYAAVAAGVATTEDISPLIRTILGLPENVPNNILNEVK